MNAILPKNLIRLAELSPKPLYVVGGSVRDFLAGLTPKSSDLDICSPMLPDEFLPIALACGFTAQSVYRHTGTVKLSDKDGVDYEYTCFRSDKYVRGEHTPSAIFFTDDMTLDAKRRDFTCNAVYYDIQKGVFVDPLQGIAAIQEKRLTTVDKAQKVFGEDGLRLMRLARQAGQLGFSPDEECFNGAQQNASMILDISPERVFTELMLLLTADEKYGNALGHYEGLCLLEKIGVLALIFPELHLGKGMAQRSDFHKYDVLFHSLRATMYAPKEVRLAALLHDVGKPYCQIEEGKMHGHPTQGKRIAHEILSRLKAPKKQTALVCELVEWHMYDFDCKTKENKLRRFFVEHAPILSPLLQVKQADFSACMDDTSVAPTVQKWTDILQKMHDEHAPFTLKELAISGNDLLTLDVPPAKIATTLKKLLLHTAVNPKDNKKERLLKLALCFT